VAVTYKCLLKKLTITLERLSKEWNSPIYAFFKRTPSIEYVKERRVHVFECSAKHCKGKGNGRMVRRYLDKTDAKSTGNLRKHAKVCWGLETVAAADETRNVDAARGALKKVKDGSITEAFERVGKGKVTYSQRQHTTIQSRCVCVPRTRRLAPELIILNTVPNLSVGLLRASDLFRLSTIVDFGL
jgi:hypothetical protein